MAVVRVETKEEIDPILQRNALNLIKDKESDLWLIKVDGNGIIRYGMVLLESEYALVGATYDYSKENRSFENMFGISEILVDAKVIIES